MTEVKTIGNCLSWQYHVYSLIRDVLPSSTEHGYFAPFRLMKHYLTSCLSVLLLLGVADARSVEHQEGQSVAKYCEQFATQYALSVAMTYQSGSLRIQGQSEILLSLSNLFQPSDSRFTAGYTCQFQALRQGDEPVTMEVSLFLTGTRHFAEHTQWERLQIIPIAYVADRTTGKAGYGVFKYLETQ